MVATPVFDPGGGLYEEAQLVTISCATEGASLYYTIDGSEPTEESSLYTEPVLVSDTLVLRARGYKTGLLPSYIASAYYYMNEIVTTEAATTEPATTEPATTEPATTEPADSYFTFDAETGTILYFFPTGVYGTLPLLVDVTVPNKFEGENVVAVGDYALSDYCYETLKSVVIEAGITSIGYRCCAYCAELVEVTLPNSITFIDDQTFIDCTSLISINL